jgi:hypothetical protein
MPLLADIPADDDEDSLDDDLVWDEDQLRALMDNSDEHLAERALAALRELYAHRYNEPRDELPGPPGQMKHLLEVTKHARPDHFRQDMRVTPRTFDKLVDKLVDDPVFTNNSRNAQMPVEEQVAIILYRFGKSGNAAGLQPVANWAGVGKGTVVKVTHRVLMAMLRHGFLSLQVRLPTEEEKEEAKAYVEEASCKAWRGGWCFVDGTLVPLFDRPHWYHESYFDRKSNYSLNIQVSKHSYACSCTDKHTLDHLVTKPPDHRFRIRVCWECT